MHLSTQFITCCVIYAELARMNIQEDIGFPVSNFFLNALGKRLAKWLWSWICLLTFVLSKISCWEIPIDIDI